MTYITEMPELEDIPENNIENNNISNNNNNNNNAFMDDILQAANEAKLQELKIKENLKKKSDKNFGNGFKKGFLSTKKKLNLSKEQSNNNNNNPNIITVTTNASNKEKKNFVITEVQEAMKNNNYNKIIENSKEWMTPDLIAKLSKNSILVTGKNTNLIILLFH